MKAYRDAQGSITHFNFDNDNIYYDFTNTVQSEVVRSSSGEVFTISGNGIYTAHNEFEEMFEYNTDCKVGLKESTRRLSSWDFDTSEAVGNTENNCNLDESLNERGSNQCWYDYECSGYRTCSSSGWCQGES